MRNVLYIRYTPAGSLGFLQNMADETAVKTQTSDRIVNVHFTHPPAHRHRLISSRMEKIMELNLWMIYEKLDFPDKQISCKNHRRQIRTIRMFESMENTLEHVLYIGRSADILHDGKSDIVCFHTSGHMTFTNVDTLTITNRILEIFDFYSDWSTRMYQAIDRNVSLSSLLTIFEDTFGSMLMAMDSTQYMIAFSKGIFENDLVSSGLVVRENRRNFPDSTLLEFNEKYGNTFSNRGVFYLPADFFPTESYVHHVYQENDRISTVIMPLVEGTWSQASPGQLEMLIPFITQWFSKNESEESSYMMTSDLARILDGNKEALPDLQRRLALFGWEPDDECRIYIGYSLSAHVNHNARLSHTLTAENAGIYAIPYQKRLVILCNHKKSDPESFQDRLANLLHLNHYCASVSLSFPRLAQIPEAYAQALYVLENNPIASGEIRDIRNCILSFISTMLKKHSSISLLHPLPEQIQTYDRAHRTEYYQTLFAYLRNERNHQMTASELFIHRNTLSLRLSKIQSIWNPELDNINERIYLLFSFYMNEESATASPDGKQ